MRHPTRKIIRALGLGAFPVYAVLIGRAFYEGFSRVVTWCGLPLTFPCGTLGDPNLACFWVAGVSGAVGLLLAGWVASTISDLTEPSSEENEGRAESARAALVRHAAALTPGGALAMEAANAVADAAKASAKSGRKP